MIGAMDIEALKNLMCDHDDTFEYSDDHHAWAKGSAEKDRIFNLLLMLRPEDAMKLVNEALWEPEVKDRWKQRLLTHQHLGPQTA